MEATNIRRSGETHRIWETTLGKKGLRCLERRLLFLCVFENVKETYLKELSILVYRDILFSYVCICSEINYFERHKIFVIGLPLELTVAQ